MEKKTNICIDSIFRIKKEKKEEISNGTYGKILKAKNKETGYYVAIKEIEKDN